MVMALLVLVPAVLYAGSLVAARRILPFAGQLWAQPPPLTVIKPVRGLDAGAEQNFRSFFEQRYPADWEMIFSLESSTDDAVPVLEQLIAAYPEVEARLVFADPSEGLTGKMSNVSAAFKEARYDYIVISDSDMRVEGDFLHRMVTPLQNADVGLVGSLPVYFGGEGCWAQALQVYAHLFSLTFGAVIADAQLPGKFAAGNQALRRSLLDEIGGLEAIGGYLTEDLRLGTIVGRRGQKIIYASMAWSPIGRLSRDELVDTLTRYLYGSRALSRPLFLFTVLLGTAHWLLPIVAAAITNVGWISAAIVLTLIRAFVAFVSHIRWAGPTSFTAVFRAGVVLDLAFVSAGLRVLLGRPLRWRGVTYRVRSDGSVQRLSV